MMEPPLLVSLLFTFLVSLSVADDASVMNLIAKSLSPAPDGWSRSNPLSKWSGVKCDSSNRVTSIVLPNKFLSGKLPAEINQLTNLKTLNFQKNQLSGALPSLANLTRLQDVFLDNNAFTSISPGCFVGLTSLQTLSIGENSKLAPWNFPKDLTDSTNLVTLAASDVSLIGTIPDIFGSFQHLQSLRLSYNYLTGSLPSSFASSSIQNLLLNNQQNGTGLSGRLDVMGAMTQLTQVWIQNNQFSGPIPDLSKCTLLVDLQLRDNSLTGVIPPSLASLPDLRNVSLRNNKLQGPLPVFGKQVQPPPEAIANNNFCISKPGPCDPQVTTLLAIAGGMGYPDTLSDNWKGNDACKGWNFITCDSGGAVTQINFGKQQFNGTISPAIANLTSLTRLFLNDNGLTGSIPNSLTELPKLEVLDVTNNNLTGKIPQFSSKVAVKTGGNPFIGIEVSDSEGGGGSSASGKKSGKLSPGVIAGIVIGVLFLVGLLVFIIIIICKKRRQKEDLGLVQTTPRKVEKEGKVNDFAAVNNEQSSQSSAAASDIHVYDGGNVAIPIEVIREVTNNFSDDNILGRGGFGVVYKGELHDGTQIAVKRMESSIVSTKGMGEFQAEIAVLTKVRHRHLVALHGFCVNGNERLLVYEYMPQGTLGQHLYECNDMFPPLTWKQRVTIALDVARGVEYLHSLAQQSFIHRDLKPSNILLGADMRAKVSDFGLVKNAPDGKYSVETRLAGTFGYLAPEYAATGRVTTKVDVFAFGVVLMEMITARKALDENLPEEQCHLVSWFRRVLTSRENIRHALDSSLDPDQETFESICKVAELAGHCTAREPYQRPDMGHAVNVLAPLVEQWKPACGDEENDSFGIDLHMSLPQVLQRWQASEGNSSNLYDSRSHSTYSQSFQE